MKSVSWTKIVNELNASLGGANELKYDNIKKQVKNLKLYVIFKCERINVFISRLKRSKQMRKTIFLNAMKGDSSDKTSSIRRRL